LENRPLDTEADPDQVVHWDTGKGLIVLKQKLQAEQEPALFWIAAKQAVR
jgi:hypothetical protein